MKRIIVLLVVMFSCKSFSQNLIIGTLVYAPPFAVAANKTSFFGFDIELMNGICTRMKVRCAYVGMPFQKLLTAVEQGVVDVAIGSITITPQREVSLLFSDAYMPSRGRFVTTQRSHIEKMADITGKKVGVVAGRQFKELVQSRFSNTVTIKEYPDMTTLFHGLSVDEVDVVAYSEPMAQFWVSSNPLVYHFVGESFSLGEGLGIATLPARQALMREINKALSEMKADGSYTQIHDLYFGKI